MWQRLLWLSLLFVALAFAVVGWGGWRRDHQALEGAAFTRQRLLVVEEESKRLQTLLGMRQREVEEYVAREGRANLEKVVANLRALPFRSPVTYREIPRSELPAILRQKLNQQLPDQEFERNAVALAALGLIPRGLELKKTYLALLGEQVGAFYDQHSRELFTFSGQSLTSSQNRVVMAHELTHALEDQHFHLERLPLEAKGNDDRALAASALVEGDATLVMNRYLLGSLTAATVRESLAAAVTTDVRQLALAPQFLRETLVFPYLKGQEFCQALYDRGGWPQLASAFAEPPSCTSQILHPEQYLADPREEPVSIDFPERSVMDAQPINDNVLGEFGVRQLLAVWMKDRSLAAEMAIGWRGDRYLVYGNGEAASYVWESIWKSTDQAEKFARASQRYLENVRGHSLTLKPNTGAENFLVATDVSRKRIIVIDAQDNRWFGAMKTRFAKEFSDTTVRQSQP